MSGYFLPRWPLLAVLTCLSGSVSAQQTRIEAPGGVAAGSITNSPITFGLKPEEEIRMVEVFTQQIAVSSEARAKAEARAAELGTQLGFTQHAVIGFFRIVGEQDVPPEHMAVKLGEVAARHRALLDRLSTLDADSPAIAVLAASAKAAVDDGRYDEADTLLLRAGEQEMAAARQAERLAQDAQQAAERRWLRAAEAEGKRGNLAMLRLRYEQAAVHFATAAGTVPATRQGERRRYLEQEAVALHLQGWERGDNKAAALAITRLSDLLRTTDRAASPLDWARMQTNLGLTLGVLGERGGGTKRLEEAVAAHRAALEERTRERVPLDWADTQVALGNALQVLGELEERKERIEKAVQTYRDALEVLTRERIPLEWARTQNNLGVALLSLGEREGGTKRLEEAVAAHRAALEERTRGRVPLQWAWTQHNLGNALSRLGERETGTGRLEEAVAAFRAALQGFTRESAPLQWAMTQYNLGNTVQALGERETGTGRLEEAVAAYRAALEEFTREHAPLRWAMTQNNLGTALSELGKHEGGTARIEEAIAAYRAALEERTRERVPLLWARTQNNLGNALHVLGKRESGTARLEEAVTTWQECLIVAEVEGLDFWVRELRSGIELAQTEIVQRNGQAHSR